MADIAQQVSEVSAHVVAINSELDTLAAEIETLTNKRLELRKQREALSKLLASKQVEQRVQTHEQAAADAQAKAEQLAADLEAKNKQADELIAKLTAQTEKPAE